MPSVFFVRCRPQNADIIELILETHRVFVGYPAWCAGIVFDEHNVSTSLVDPRLSDEAWNKPGFIDKRNRGHSSNRNLIREVESEPGSIVLIPRPDRGLIYAGKVSPFEIVDDPSWVDKYLQMRDDQGCDEGYGFQSHVGDVCQGWPAREIIEIPYFYVPTWIRKSFNGRSQHGRIKGVPALGLNPYDVMSSILATGGRRAPLEWTRDATIVGGRLVDLVGPQSFEHLCVGLLQLMHPEQIWTMLVEAAMAALMGLGFQRTASYPAYSNVNGNIGGEIFLS